jgi:hypothetical protein
MKKYAVLLMTMLVAAACATTTDDAGWEDWGGFTLANSEIAVHHRVKEGQHRLELLRRLGERDGTMRWDTLDVVPITLEPNTLVCVSATSTAGSGDYVAIAEDDAAHNHPVLRAWRVDTTRRKLVATDAAGVLCNAKEEPRTR